MWTVKVSLMLFLSSVLVACGGASDPVAHGKQIYDKLGCNACHAIGGQGGTTGPDQTTLATTAVQRIKDPGYKGNARDAAGYIRESIIQPGAYVVPGFPDNLMPTTFGQQLSAQDLDDLVARRDKIVGLYEAGKSLDEAEKTMGDRVTPRVAPSITGLTPFRAGRDRNFTETVYNELSRR